MFMFMLVYYVYIDPLTQPRRLDTLLMTGDEWSGDGIFLSCIEENTLVPDSMCSSSHDHYTSLAWRLFR